ncbi:hypothetical protein LLG96_09565 [bacterium]|nr:hypothetical protein [bacterium]
MELLINLIIIFIIVASVLKRLSAVSRKGRELETTRLPGDVIETAGPVGVPRPPDRESAWTPYPEIPAGDTMETADYPVTTSEELLESSPSETIPERTAAYQRPSHEPAVPRHREVRRHQGMGMKLAFTSHRVVNGIIMSEILGKPVGMRE